MGPARLGTPSRLCPEITSTGPGSPRAGQWARARRVLRWGSYGRMRVALDGSTEACVSVASDILAATSFW